MECTGKRSNWVRSAIFTSLFCLAIAVITSSIWTAPYYENAFISLGYGYSALFFSWLIERWLPKIAAMRIASLVMSISGAVCLGTINAYFWLRQYPGFDAWQGLKPVLLLGIIFTAISFYFFHAQEKQFSLQQQIDQAKLDKAKQDNVLIESELKQLQSQIEPHFLFNTLANINILIDYDANQAKEVLDKLTILLRGSMSRHRQTQIDVASEVALIRAYLGIQQVRLGSRLRFDIDIPDELSTIKIPPYLLQPLVENAVIHGIEPSVVGGSIEINARQEGEFCILEISDSGVGLQYGNRNSENSNHGIGLSNVKERLLAKYGEKSSLSVNEKKEGGVMSTIVLPTSTVLPMQNKQEA
ncbi:hypothetical protein BCU70_02755 [Vibrio sp. 10N.286.49.C2]|uniref:sensor histidine kinase n=1 Tax=unclassified Vibrio TaxID=2614977 RepID=UPI000C83B14A|nr:MULTISPECIES: histidine kinase [unclassified Vibrio]PMH38214.1 hypothetical protein BCU70_02755 [Vibrio sp. 10N.286.49.C2]PMH55622.1 hypothetical protein BCU66_08350 [Vibrio sp. 10N.286.49.B1]PMH78222.1 hypothetical protein BCU58_01035 [Vibrio sp. 10N.286.48.B7]